MVLGWVKGPNKAFVNGKEIQLAGSSSGPAFPNSIPNVGGTLSWAGKTWIVVHKVTGIAFLGLNGLDGTVAWVSHNDNRTYLVSRIHNTCIMYAAQLNLHNCDYILDVMCGKIFVASYAQLNGDFSYFTDSSKRNVGKTYWTATSCGNYGVWRVDDYGSLVHGMAGVVDLYGFRPFIALRI